MPREQDTSDRDIQVDLSENVDEPDMKGIEEGFDAKTDFIQAERGRVRTSSQVFRNKEQTAKHQLSSSFNIRGDETSKGGKGTN